MSHTYHHNQARFFDGKNGRIMPNAPAWFRRLLTRRTKRRQNTETRDIQEVVTRERKTSNWLWW
jgi:hypothetical protein